MDCSGKNSTQTASLSMATSLVAFQVLGLALYQAGALHLKSINNILLQAFINIALGSLLWYSVGYSLVFGSSQEGFIGNPDKAFFIDVSPFNCSTHAQNVPSVLFAAFEMTIAVCAPFMVIAPWTEHISIIGSMALFILWPITVYYPISHWIRGAGWLTRLDVLDYAGSLTVHTSAGTAGVVFTRMLKPHISTHDANSKTSHHHGDAYHHVMFLGGALIIIFGWSLFNVCTVQMVQDASVGLAVVNTQLSACASCLCWVLVFTIGSRQCLYSDMLTGIIAGIIGVSAAPASLHAWASVLTGILVGVTSSLVLTCARRYFPSWTNGSQVDIIFSNGIPGSLGALAAGLFANPILDARHHRGAFYSNGKQLGVQLLAIVIVALWTAVCTYLITWFIHLTVGFNITHSAAVDVALPGQSSSSKLHSQFLQREKLFSAAITGQVRDLEDLAAKHMNFGIKDFDKRTVLLLASSHGHIQCVKVILRQPGIDIHAKDRWGATALTEAIKYGHDRVVQCLIRHGASWAEDGAGGLLCTAVVKNDIEEISRLVSLGVDVNAPNSDGHCAIHVASKLGSRAVVQYLIDQRAEMNTIDSSGNAPLNYADMHEHRAVSQLLESLGARRVSRHYSIQEISEVASTGNLQMLRHMVHNGASICYRDVNHRTPLHVTSAEGHLDVVKFLVLQPGININAHDKNQFTPLLEAIINKHHDVVEFLKSHGAAVNECKLASLVTEKARDGDTKCLKRMLRWSGHVNICDFDGQTALHVAVMNGRTDAVSMLLREGADATLVNRFNKTPLELASSLHHTSLEKELRKHLKLSTQVSEASKQTDENTTSCYQRKSKSRRRKYKTEPSTYHYSSRDSWSSTDVSAEARKHLESSASTDNTSQQILSMRDVQNHQENNVLRPSFLRVMPVSQLSPQTRELTGGQPDYV